MIRAGLKKAFRKNLKVGLENVCEEMVMAVAIAIVFHLWKCPKSDRKTNLVSWSMYIVLLRHVVIFPSCGNIWGFNRFLAIPVWNANKTFNSYHLPFQEKVSKSGGRRKEERKEEAVVLQYAENDCRASWVTSETMWPYCAKVWANIYCQFRFVQKHCCAHVLCCWPSLLTRCCPFALEGFLLHVLQLSTCRFVRSVSWSAPESLQITVECHLPALKSMFPTLPHTLFRHSLLLDLPFPTFAFL